MGTLIKSSFDNLLESKNASLVNEMIARKQSALTEASENADYFNKKGMTEHAENETARVQLLIRDIEKLKVALN